MPMMLDRSVYPTNMPPECEQTRQTYYGHPRRQATTCGHILHASAPSHTPLCPACIASQTKAKMDSALQGLIFEGGLLPPGYMRDRRWQRAKLRYEVANRRQAKARGRAQLRAEREQAWEETHQRSNAYQVTTVFEEVADCSVCALMIANQSTTVPEARVAKGVAWWEKPGALIADHILVPRTPPRPVRALKDTPRSMGSPTLRIIVRGFRRAMMATDAHRQAWDLRYRTESAVRRKHSLGQEFQFDPDFWDAPISAYISRKNHRHVKDEQRMAARRARGNTARPRPPRSSLSYSAHTDEVEIDERTLEEIERREDMKRLERVARKVGEEVGYLYFIGGIDGLLCWREDYLRSDRQLVYRKQDPESKCEEPRSDSAEAGGEDDNTSDEEDDGDDEDCKEEPEEDDEEDCDEMEIDR